MCEWLTYHNLLSDYFLNVWPSMNPDDVKSGFVSFFKIFETRWCEPRVPFEGPVLSLSGTVDWHDHLSGYSDQIVGLDENTTDTPVVDITDSQDEFQSCQEGDHADDLLADFPFVNDVSEYPDT